MGLFAIPLPGFLFVVAWGLLLSVVVEFGQG
jgi:hypothetical protein